MLEFKNLCGECFSELFNQQSPKYLDSSLVCHHIPNALVKNEDTLEYSLQYFENSVMVLTNPASLDTYFLLDEYEKQILLSFEKPILLVSIQDEELKRQLHLDFIHTKIMDSAPLSVQAYRLFCEKVPYFFIKASSDDYKVFVHKQKTYTISPSVFSTPLEAKVNDKKYNLIYNYLNEFDLLNSKTLVVRANSKTFLEFFVYENEEMTKIADLSNLSTKNLLKNIALTSGPKERLVDNFRAKFATITQNIEAKTATNIDFMDLLDTIFEANSFDLATSFIGNGGLKIDTKLDEHSFDLNSFFGSILSYKLAGVENKIIAFSVYESLADFVLHIANELKIKVNFDHFVLFGDLLINQVFFSRIEKNGAGLAPKISTTFAIDV